MTINYPNGFKRDTSPAQSYNQLGNRGMSLETDINATNKYYLEIDKAIVHKKPTPIQVVRVNYPKRSAAVITEAYFQRPSTTDYNGLYRHKYIDFEAKETKNKTRFPLSNIHEHQIKHIQSIIKHGGIAFLIIRFTTYNKTYFLQGEILLEFWNRHMGDGKKSISYKEIKEQGYLIPLNYNAVVDYLKIIDQLYF